MRIVGRSRGPEIQKRFDVFKARVAEAAVLLRKVTGLDPVNPAAWRQLGITLVMLGELGSARAALERSLELSPAQNGTAFVLQPDRYYQWQVNVEIE